MIAFNVWRSYLRFRENVIQSFYDYFVLADNNLSTTIIY